MAFKDIFVIVRTKRDDLTDFQVVGQTMNEALKNEIISSLNDNDKFIKKPDGSIAGDKTLIEAFPKDLLRDGLGSTESI